MAYCERSDVEAIFGVSNVATWADLNNNQDDDEILERINWAMDLATTKMDNRLRGGPYTVPFEAGSSSSSSGYDAELVNETARWAGVILYESRGIADTEDAAPDNVLGAHKKEIDKFIRNVRTGRLRLNVDSTIMYPKIVKD